MYLYSSQSLGFPASPSPIPVRNFVSPRMAGSPRKDVFFGSAPVENLEQIAAKACSEICDMHSSIASVQEKILQAKITAITKLDGKNVPESLKQLADKMDGIFVREDGFDFEIVTQNALDEIDKLKKQSDVSDEEKKLRILQINGIKEAAIDYLKETCQAVQAHPIADWMQELEEAVNHLLVSKNVE